MNHHSKIKTISVKREVIREVMVQKKFKENVDVELTDLTVDEIYQLPLELSRAVSVAFKKLYEEYKSISAEQSGLINFISEPTLNPQATEAEEGVKIPIDDQTPVTGHPHVGSGSNEALIGNKHDHATSKFHYVFWNTGRKKWCNTMTNDAFDSEIACASFVDSHLDKIGDDTKPRNNVGNNDDSK